MKLTVPSGPEALRDPLEALAQLKTKRYGGIEAYPLFMPKDPQEMHDFLGRYAPAVNLLPEKKLEKLWEEVRGKHPENFLVARRDTHSDFAWIVDRNIRTAALRIYRSRLAPTRKNPEHHIRETLWEFKIQTDGVLVPRPFNNSGSEKLYWTEPTPHRAFRRLLREEMGFRNGNARLERFHLVGSIRRDTTGEPEFDQHTSAKFGETLCTNNEIWHGVKEVSNTGQMWHHEPRTPNLFVYGKTDRAPEIHHLRDLGLALKDLGRIL